MEPVAIIAAAVAVGASEGVRETSKQVIIDAYAALRDWLTSKYGSLVAELTGLEKEPEENLRRALLAKKLAGAGANVDVRLCDLADFAELGRRVGAPCGPNSRRLFAACCHRG